MLLYYFELFKLPKSRDKAYFFPRTQNDLQRLSVIKRSEIGSGTYRVSSKLTLHKPIATLLQFLKVHGEDAYTVQNL